MHSNSTSLYRISVLVTLYINSDIDLVIRKSLPISPTILSIFRTENSMKVPRGKYLCFLACAFVSLCLCPVIFCD